MLGSNVAWGDLATIVGAVIAVWGVIWALIQYRQSKRVQRAEFLSTLVRRFADEDVRSILASIDYEDRGESWFRNVEQDVDCRLKAEAVFKFLASICYLLNKNLIDHDEYQLFADQMKDLLLNDNVKRYLVDEREECSKIKGTAIELVRFGMRSKLRGYDNLVEEVKRINDISQREENTMSATKGREANKEKKNVVLIRISRLYREGMTSDELYAITRGIWRANLSVIENYKIAMAVVGGEIKGVFAIKKWNRSEENNSRVEFEGCLCNDELLNRYVGKNIREMFPHGSANPIRYTTTDELEGFVKEVKR